MATEDLADALDGDQGRAVPGRPSALRPNHDVPGPGSGRGPNRYEQWPATAFRAKVGSTWLASVAADGTDVIRP